MPFFLKLLSTEYSLLDQKLNDLRKFYIFFLFKISYQKKCMGLFIAYINPKYYLAIFVLSKEFAVAMQNFITAPNIFHV